MNCKINWKLFPIKLHYLLFFGGLGSVLQFIQLVEKDLGINTFAVGITFAATSVATMLAKPLFGFLADYFKNIQRIALPLIAVSAIAFPLVLLLKPLDVPAVTVECFVASSRQRTLLNYEKDCFVRYFSLEPESQANFSLKCDNVSSAVQVGLGSVSKNRGHKLSTGSRTLLEDESHLVVSSVPRLTCDCLGKHPPEVACDDHENSCDTLHASEKKTTVLRTPQFWLFTVLAVVAGASEASAESLTDAACCEILRLHQDTHKHYGQQRMWGTIGWGVVAPLTGLLNELASHEPGKTNYTPCFALLASLFLIDLVILSRIEMPKTTESDHIWADVGSIFRSLEVFAVTLGVFVAGALTALIWNFQFIYLHNLGASQILVGLTSAMQTLLGEAPFFFISGYLIKSMGHLYCFALTFAALSLRLGLYSLLSNPWYVLPIEMLQGVDYGLFLATMVSYASFKSSQGTDATMLGIFEGVFEGLGIAVGTLLGGLGFCQIGGKAVYVIGSIISLATMAFFIILKKVQ